MDEFAPKTEGIETEDLLDKANRAGKAIGLPGQITVKRSSGELDPGWLVITGSKTDDGQDGVMVTKKIDGQDSYKTVGLEEARLLNPVSSEDENVSNPK